MKLRELSEKDISGMLEWMHDPEIGQYFQFDAASATPDTALNYIRSASNDPNSRHFAIVDENDDYLGTISLKSIDNKNRCAEYAISTRKKAHGQGVAKWATSSILDKAFDELDLNRVYLNVLTDNTRANRFYTKFGFVFEGTSRQHVYIRGKFKDLNWYAMLRKEWKERSLL